MKRKGAECRGCVRVSIGFNDLVCVAVAISLSTEHDSSPQERIDHLVGVFVNGIGSS